jgi:hypothetical protein
MYSPKHNCIVTFKFMGVQINEYEAVYVNMRRISFALVAMSVIAAALMSSIIPSGSFELIYAQEDESSQDNGSEENQQSEDESDNEEEDNDSRSQDDDDGGEDDNDDDESSRSQDDDDSDDDSDDNSDENSDDNSDENSDDENGDEGDSSETGTEQESEQKNVCSGWAVCINEATNAEDSAIGGGLGAQTVSETPMLLSLPL